MFVCVQKAEDSNHNSNSNQNSNSNSNRDCAVLLVGLFSNVFFLISRWRQKVVCDHTSNEKHRFFLQVEKDENKIQKSFHHQLA